MKVVGFNGSARKNGNTAILVNRVFQELQKEGIETELVQLSGEKIRGCIACYKCFENKDQRCSVTNDVLNSCVEKKSRLIRRHLNDEATPPIALHGEADPVNTHGLFTRSSDAVICFRRTGRLFYIQNLPYFH